MLLYWLFRAWQGAKLNMAFADARDVLRCSPDIREVACWKVVCWRVTGRSIPC
jgi:hypothetical protein